MASFDLSFETYLSSTNTKIVKCDDKELWNNFQSIRFTLLLLKCLLNLKRMTIISLLQGE